VAHRTVHTLDQLDCLPLTTDSAHEDGDADLHNSLSKSNLECAEAVKALRSFLHLDFTFPAALDTSTQLLTNASDHTHLKRKAKVMQGICKR
jgi:hypothetical protein